MASPRRPRQSGPPLTANHALIQALVAALFQLHPKALGGMIRFHNKVMTMTKRQRAVHFREFLPEESDEEIAAMVGVDRSTLFTWPEYMETKAMLKRVYTLHRGSSDGEGNIEAIA